MNPTRHDLTVNEGDSTAFVKALRGRVFHVTFASNLESICEAGYVAVNSDGTLPTTFGNSENSLFRQLSCVSVFDYEEPTEIKWREYWGKCDPLGPARTNPPTPVAFLFLSEKSKKALVRWSKASRSWKSERVVPYVEAGHRGNLSLSSVSEIMVVHLKIDKKSIEHRLNQGRDRSAKRAN